MLSIKSNILYMDTLSIALRLLEVSASRGSSAIMAFFFFKIYVDKRNQTNIPLF